jgi:thioredoxin reductase (NADPH)
MNNSTDVIVIGAGMSGLYFAQHALQIGLKVEIFEHQLFGGLVINVNHLYSSSNESMGSGVDLASDILQVINDQGSDLKYEEVLKIDKVQGLFEVMTNEQIYFSRRVVLASGSSFKPLVGLNEEVFLHNGLSHCADCDGPLYQNQDVVVIGGGDSAVQEALVLSDFCQRVYLIQDQLNLTAQFGLIQKLNSKSNIETHLGAKVLKILGDQQVLGVQVQLNTGLIQELVCSGIFPFVGLVPSSAYVPSQIQKDSLGAVLVDEELQTSLKGVYAIGAVRSGFSGYLIDAQKEAEIAARSIAQTLRIE